MKNRIYTVAEIGVNHNGDINLARRMIDAAADCGANAVKFQTFKVDRLVAPGTEKAPYQRNTTAPNQSQSDMLRQLELNPSAHHILAEHCHSLGIDFVSTPFDIESLIFLVKDIGIPWIKIPSGEIINGPLLHTAAKTGLPLVISTGMANEGEIMATLSVVGHGLAGDPGSPDPGKPPTTKQWGLIRQKVTLLLCTTAYPAPYSDVNLRAMNRLAELFGTPVGISDHTLGIAVSLAAVALGACMIEKHFTTDRNLPGPDQSASLEPDEFRRLVEEIRIIESAMGKNIKQLMPSERDNILVARQGLVAARDINKGELFSKDNLTTRRPASGSSPMRYWELLGHPADHNYKSGEPINQ